ncbi:hypothetical protein Tco_1375761 [Tanacetum coccineum]
MAILVISISLDSSDESVGPSPSRIISFGAILAEILAKTPSILFVVPALPHTSPFLYTGSFDSDTSERPHSQDLPTNFLLVDLIIPYDSSSDSSLDSSSDYSSDFSSGHSLPDSSVDAPATIFARPSRKRCRSPFVSVLLATPIPGALSPVPDNAVLLATPIPGALSLIHADLLPPRKRIRGFVTTSDYDTSIEESYEAYTEPGIDSDVQADIDVDAEATTAREVDVGVEVGIRSDREDEVEEEAESVDRGTIEIRVDMVLDIESA